MKIYSYNELCNISGANIRTLRRKQGLSQGMLAAKLQVNNVQLEQKAISRIECGERLVADYELLAFAEALNCTVNTLLIIHKDENGQVTD
ncbi:MAG: helix-turn-helix transcriptional regulator [Oscillospiraceae bacterium]